MVIEELVKTVLSELRTTTKIETIVGDPIEFNNIMIVPVSKVSIGFGAGGGKGDSDIKGGEATGGGLSIEPIAFLVIRDDGVELISMRGEESGFGKIIDMIPQMAEKFKNKTGGGKKNKSAKSSTETEEET